MRRLKKVATLSPYEFDLDLAPLLAVMVKLVPVLLLSSAFIQVMMVETELPQAVKEAVQKQEEKPTTSIQVRANLKQGFEIVISKNGTQKSELVPLKEGAFDFNQLQKKLQAVKLANPQVFSIELAPESNIPYRDVVHITDEARKSRDRDVKFPLFDAKENKTVMTDYMFPDVVFTNIFDG
ncbi:MAG: biopolymer transporter ExbD [Bdellovibrio sp. CG10_big_fil_rev_8_21_14_0_10_47_8]|nr:MAG: biopolymer transporter ExbD [Bdellovibrio sp. CG10_big_fil_rev_8_21_14_0_10_47_8]